MVGYLPIVNDGMADCLELKVGILPITIDGMVDYLDRMGDNLFAPVVLNYDLFVLHLAAFNHISLNYPKL